MYLVTEWYGVLLVDERGRVEKRALFPKDAREIAERLARAEAGEVLAEEREVVPERKFRVLEPRLAQLPGAELVLDGRLPEIHDDAASHGYGRALMHDAALIHGKAKVRASAARRDQHIVQAVDAIDELSAEANVVVERLREWYGLHYPELLARIERHEELAGVISAHGTREKISAARPEYALDSPMGADLGPAEESSIRSLARSASTLYATRADLEKYLDEAMPQLAPNLTVLLGAVLAARLIRQAGGLNRLAMMPAGTIQTLGAEKALFRHIKEGKKPPKHGVLFAHPALHRAERSRRGPLARALAAKAAIAARADALTKDPTVGPRLLADFEARAEQINVERSRPRAPRADAGGFQRKGGGFERGPPRGGGTFQRGPPRGGQFGRGPPRGGGGGAFRPKRDFRGGDRR